MIVGPSFGSLEYIYNYLFISALSSLSSKIDFLFLMALNRLLLQHSG